MAVEIKAVVTVIPKLKEKIPPQHTLILKLASTELGPNEEQKPMIQGEAKINGKNEWEYKYEAIIEVPIDFGDVGAVIVEINEKSEEKYIENISLHYPTPHSITFSCNSWVQPQNRIPDRRIFFSTKSYLPVQTPSGLVKLREEDLCNLRGERDGEEDMEERKKFERIYNYDVYNDLGNPDENADLKRPVLGGPNYPYPRRCRTGRPRCSEDSSSEQRSKTFYVPRDEEFSEVKQALFPTNESKPPGGLETTPFLDFTEIDLLFRDGIPLPTSARQLQGFDILSGFLSDASASDTQKPSIIRFPPPEAVNRDKFNWVSDIEFARQTLAGLNPCRIQLVKSWPPPDSEMTIEKIQKEIGCMTVQEAIDQKKLFILDYHDILLPYVAKVRSIKGTTLYGSRTLFFLNSDDTLRLLAIELTRPPMDGITSPWKKVFTPNQDATNAWLWRMAKAHVLAHDSCYHQLVSHWLRTHCAVEPYVIAAHRQLSAMHPIYRLLHPHFRYTLRINANAREVLINAGGIIEGTFSAARYSMELSSMVYDKEWQFDLQALPDDLIHRGMAEKDEDAPHGLKLTIKDYPFANDGLILWDALKEWVTVYVKHYYPTPRMVVEDKELQKWWKEIREKGHKDKMGKPGWPNLETREDLIKIITTIAWVASGHHAAVNFGQYAHAAYFPSRPSIARTNMPTDEDSNQLPLNKPEDALLQSFPSVAQAMTVANTMWILSTHSPDEEYVGKKIETSWAENPVIAAAFAKFKVKMEALEKTIDDRNENPKFKNRHGDGIVPYELLKPTSRHGVTGKGVPYSIST